MRRASLVRLLAALAAGFAVAAVLWGVAGTTPPGLNVQARTLFSRPPSTYVDARTLAANVAETVTIPTFSGAPAGAVVVVVFSADCANYYVNVTNAAAAPSGDVTDGSASERNPASLTFAQAATFSLAADATCHVTMADYQGAR